MPARTLIFGGTFDPPHLAHTRLPALAAEQLHCDRILYVPAFINPLKSEQPGAATAHRLAMLQRAIAEVPNAEISTIEIDRGGPSYTIDTVRALRQQHPQCKFRLLIGADQALDFHRWKDWEEIVRLAPPAVMLRPPWDEALFRAALQEKYAPPEAQQWIDCTLRLPMLDVSATDIRARLHDPDDPELQRLLAPAVLEYIREHRPYRSSPPAAT